MTAAFSVDTNKRKARLGAGGITNMKKEILISSTSLETRAAIIECVEGSKFRLADYFVDRPNRQKIVGNIYKGRVANVLPGLNSAFINIGIGRNAYLQVDDVVPQTKKIQSVLKSGADVMVQVTKDAIGTKGPKITMDISLTGRLCVLMPFSDKIGVSKNIEDRPIRSKLKDAISKALSSQKLEYGVIARTESEDAAADEIAAEIKYLDKLWKVIKNKYEQSKPPKLVYGDLDAVEQVIRDYFTDEVESLLTDSDEVHKQALEYVEDIAPELASRIKVYKNRTPIFTAFDVEKELDGLLCARVKLPSGGYIIIQEAESLCAIDVNSGKFLGSSLEDTVTRTNIEAAQEIARQLRLRNIGGIIVIDFIDMKNRQNQRKVVDALREAMKSDKAKIKIFPVTNLGLIELSRSRKSSSLRSFMGEACAVCGGSGMVPSRQTVFIKVAAEIDELLSRRRLPAEDVKVKIRLHPDVAAYFLENKDKLPVAASIQKDAAIPPGEYNIILE
ncbi:MAG: Rne/Rng family ribonuclease [Elusimicrobia bacterium HGW-Elusimicrobia-1]|nr:MAG: Rne/Rng family ribonuclease [Elusimicrobia bacterium HGW-Elusimicrobia-1]